LQLLQPRGTKYKIQLMKVMLSTHFMQHFVFFSEFFAEEILRLDYNGVCLDDWLQYNSLFFFTDSIGINVDGKIMREKSARSNCRLISYTNYTQKVNSITKYKLLCKTNKISNTNYVQTVQCILNTYSYNFNYLYFNYFTTLKLTITDA